MGRGEERYEDGKLRKGEERRNTQERHSLKMPNRPVLLSEGFVSVLMTFIILKQSISIYNQAENINTCTLKKITNNNKKIQQLLLLLLLLIITSVAVLGGGSLKPLSDFLT